MRDLFRIALDVSAAEYIAARQLGADALDAHLSAWEAYDDVVSIGSGPAPTFYQTTEAKMILGKGKS
jgi:hypothetical protein